jgi:hypothetical protein
MGVCLLVWVTERWFVVKKRMVRGDVDDDDDDDEDGETYRNTSVRPTSRHGTESPWEIVL